MTKYTLRRKVGNRLTYVYRTGFKVSVIPNYPQFLKDLVDYANVDADDIETEEDLIDLFDKAKNRGFDFGKSGDGVEAIKREWERLGNVFRKPKEDRQVFLERELEKEFDVEQKTKIQRRIIRVRERGHIVTYREHRVLFRWVFKK